jgi:hypothetical protein
MRPGLAQALMSAARTCSPKVDQRKCSPPRWFRLGVRVLAYGDFDYWCSSMSASGRKRTSANLTSESVRSLEYFGRALTNNDTGRHRVSAGDVRHDGGIRDA